MCIRSTDGFWRPWVQVYITPRFGVGTSSTQWISFTGGGNRRWDPVLKTRIWGSSCLPACLHGSWLHQRSTWLGLCQLLQLISKLVRKLWIVMDYEGEPVDHPPPAQQSCCTQSLWDHWSRKAWISSMQNIHEMVCLTTRKYNLDPLNISQWEKIGIKHWNIIGPTIPLERRFPCDII